MKSVELTAYQRAAIGRIALKKVRNTGRIPAVIYGRGSKAQSLELNQKDIDHLIHQSVSETRLVDVVIDGDKGTRRLALVQQVQHHPLTGGVLHIDLREVSQTEKVVVNLPVETTGESEGVKTGGGLLEHVLFKVRIRALPQDIPEFIEVDVSHVALGETVHLGDITPPPGVEILGDRNIPVVSIAVPREAQAEEETEAEAKEPEVIKEKKETPEEEKKKDEKKK